MLSITVMHAPWSRACGAAAALVADLGGAYVVEAVRGAGVWDTARRAWLAHGALATHHLVVQDDAVPPVRASGGGSSAPSPRVPHVVTALPTAPVRSRRRVSAGTRGRGAPTARMASRRSCRWG